MERKRRGSGAIDRRGPVERGFPSGRMEDSAMRKPAVLTVLLLSVIPALAQQSASYKLNESVFNGGGNPSQGAVLSSASFRIKLDSMGEGLLGTALGSASFRVDGGFAAAYPPPGEVKGDVFSSKTLYAWNPEKSVGVYNVYRSTLSSLPGTFGSCLAGGLATTTYSDASVPGTGTGYFYLVTAENRLGEEGTKGFQTGGAQRTTSPACP
jgi:hypothetical protein